MLAGATDIVVRVRLIVVVHVAIVHIDVVCVVWIVRIRSTRPIVVTLETVSFNSFRLNHDDILSPSPFNTISKGLRSERWHSFFLTCLFANKQFRESFISFVKTFSNSLFDLQYQGFSLLEKNMHFLYQAD